MYCIIMCIAQGKQARVKNANLRHPSCTVVMLKRKTASPVLSVLMHILCFMCGIAVHLRFTKINSVGIMKKYNGQNLYYKKVASRLKLPIPTL